MERDILPRFISWKDSPYRKPLLLQGARQTGKTWLLKEFGKSHYEQFIYCNFEEEPMYDDFFKSSLNPREIIQKLAHAFNAEIHPETALIVFDEIQLSANAINSLKYFCEKAPEYHVAAAGSLIGVRVSKPGSFPVGKVDILDVHPMTFPEFLTALGERGLREVLDGIQQIEPLALPFHERLLALLKAYYIVGGMPEAVARYVQTRSLNDVRTIQDAILRLYTLDFAKHAPKEDIPRLSIIWDSIPSHLARENKKFIFSELSSSARARNFESALQWLSDAGLIHRAFALEHIEQPMAGFARRNIFKVFTLDTGLLAAQARLPMDIFVRGDDLFHTFHGAFVENYVAQQLVGCQSDGNARLYYWRSESRKAEIDFIVDVKGAILPLEVKAGVNPKSKSLSVYDVLYKPAVLPRTTLLNLMRNGRYVNIPLYAITKLAMIMEHIEN